MLQFQKAFVIATPKGGFVLRLVNRAFVLHKDNKQAESSHRRYGTRTE
jgi:hypothetical protein